MKKINVIITTDKRGVFAGQMDPADLENTAIKLENARMAVRWSEEVKGVLGLAATGPIRSCRITKAVPSIRLEGVTAVMEMTDEAYKAWEKEPWG